MSEHERAEANSTDHHAANAHRDMAAGRTHDGLSSSPPDGLGDAFPSHTARRTHFPKDDRRSSARLTEREQNERWPLG